MSGGVGRVLTQRALLVGALACLIGFLTLTAIVTQQRFDSVDRLARALVHQSRHPLLSPSMEVASFLGGEPGQTAVVVLGSAMLWRRRRWGASLPIVMVGAGILVFVAKWTVDRPRPNLDPWGFPSGHVLSLLVLLGYIACVVGKSNARREWRVLGVGACVALVSTVAYSRMYLDAHWLSDVLGGLSIGLAYLFVVIWVIGSTPPFWKGPGLRAAPARSIAEGVPAVVATRGPTAAALLGPAAETGTEARLVPG
jgi:membrane-associated phospholipid phosphatase